MNVPISITCTHCDAKLKIKDVALLASLRGERLRGSWAAGYLFVVLFLAIGAGQARPEDPGAGPRTDREPVLTVQDGQSGKQIKVIEFSHDGRMVLTAGGPDFKAVLWDVATGRQIRDFRGHAYFIQAAALSNDNSLALTAGQDKTARLWDAATGRELRRFEAAETIEAAALSPDGKRALTGSWDGAAQLWDTGNGARVRRFPISGQIVQGVAFAPSGDVVAVAGDDEVLLFKIDSARPFARCERPFENPRGLRFSSDGRRLTALAVKVAQVWNAADGTLVSRIDEVTPLAFSNDGTTLFVDDGGKSSLLDAATGKRLRRYLKPLATIAAAFSPDDALILGTGDDEPRLYRADTGEELLRFLRLTTGVYSAAISSDGRYLAAGHSDGTIHVWDFDDGRQVRTLERHQGAVEGVAFHPSGKTLLSGSWDGTTRWWLLDREQEITGRREQLGRSIKAVGFSSNGRRWLVQTLGEGTVLLDHDEFDNPSGILRSEATLPMGYAAALSPDDRLVLSSHGEKDASLWNAGDGKERKRLSGHSELVRAVAFSADGTLAVTGSYDKTACIWETVTGRIVQRLKGHDSPISAVAVSRE